MSSSGSGRNVEPKTQITIDECVSKTTIHHCRNGGVFVAWEKEDEMGHLLPQANTNGLGMKRSKSVSW